MQWGAEVDYKWLALKMSADKALSVRFNKVPRSLSKYIVLVLPLKTQVCP